jgi:hypothetical protein
MADTTMAFWQRGTRSSLIEHSHLDHARGRPPSLIFLLVPFRSTLYFCFAPVLPDLASAYLCRI